MKPTAVVGRRVLALLIDYIVLGAIDLAIYFPLASSKDKIIQDLSTGKLDSGASTYVNIGDHSLVGSKAALYFLLTFVIGVFLLIVLPGLKGWSIGKAATGIRIVKEDGTTPPGILRVFVRNLMWIVDDFPYIIPFLTGFVMAASTAQNRRVGDIVAGTLVVKKEFAGQPAVAPLPTAPMPSAMAPTPAPATAGAPPADWYPDPEGLKRLRYWDGAAWTQNTAD